MMGYLLCIAIGVIIGLIISEYLPPDFQINQDKVKIKNSPGAINEMNTTTDTTGKPGFFKRLFKRKTMTKKSQNKNADALDTIINGMKEYEPDMLEDNTPEVGPNQIPLDLGIEKDEVKPVEKNKGFMDKIRRRNRHKQHIKRG